MTIRQVFVLSLLTFGAGWTVHGRWSPLEVEHSRTRCGGRRDGAWHAQRGGFQTIGLVFKKAPCLALVFRKRAPAVFGH